MTLAYYGKSPKRRLALVLGALLAVLMATAGGLALKSALAGTPTSGDKSDVKGASFSSGPTLLQTSTMSCTNNNTTAASFSSSVSFTLSAPTQAGAHFVFYLIPNGGSNANPAANVPMNEVSVDIGGLAIGAHTVPFTLPVTHSFTATKGGILIVFADDANGTTTWSAKSNSLNCQEAVVSPTVALVKTDDTSGSVAAGGTFHWILTATVSDGPTTHATTISDTAPTGMTFGTVTPSGTGLTCPTHTATQVTCTLASGATSGTYTVTILVTAPSGSVLANCKKYTNSATASYNGSDSTDTDDVTVTGCSVTNPTITKSASATAISGGKAHWDIVINNTGANTVAITGVVITDAGATLDSTVPSGACTVTSSPFQCNVAANSTTTLHVSKTLPAAQCADNTVSNSVTSAAMPTGTPLQVTNNANTTISVPGTAAANCLTVSKAYNSQANTYVITIVNTGPSASVVVKDTYNANGTGETLGTTAVSPSGTCLTADLTGASGCTLTVANGTTTITTAILNGPTPTGCNDLETNNSVAVTFNGSAVGGSPTSNVHHVYTSTKANCVPGLTVTKSGPGSVAQGANYTYGLTVTNTGIAATSGTITIHDTLPAGVAFVSDDSNDWTCSGSGSPVLVTCTSNIVLAASGGSSSFNITVTAPSGVCTPIENVAHVTGGGDSQTHDSGAVDTSVTGCTRTITIVKLMKDGSSNSQTFSGTIGNDAAGFTGLQVSTLVGQHPQSHTESSTQSHDVSETAQAGFVLDGYEVIADTTSAGRCFPNNAPTTNLSPTAPIPADSHDYLVCMVNHPAQGRLIIEKDNIGGNSADTFTADITGGEQNISFSENTSATRSLSPGSVTVHEDAKAGYTYLGFTEGHCVPQLGQVADLVIREDVVAQTGDFTGTIVDGQDTIVCFHNQKTRHIIIIKDVNNAGQICDQTLFPIVEDSQTANSQTAGDISDCGTKIETDVDTSSHTFTETPLPNGYTFVDAFESDPNCAPVEKVTGTAIGNTYVLDSGTDDETICFVNHKPQGTLIIKKVNVDGVQTDVFTADIAGGEQDIQFSASGFGPAFRTLIPGSYSVSEDARTGYKYLGFALGDSDHICPSAPTSNGSASTTNDVSIADNQTTTICFYNDGVGHIQVNKIDQTNGIAPQPGSWLFDVTGPQNDLGHSIALGGGQYTIDVPLGTYTATETNGDFSACPTVNESGAWRTQALTNTTQSLTTPDQTIVFTFENAACDIVLGTGNLVIEKYSDFDANHTINGSDALLNGWTVTVTGPQFPGGQSFVTGANGNPFGTVLLSGIKDGAYTVTETNQAGFTVVGVVNVNTNTFTSGASGGGTVADGVTTTIRFFNQPKVNIHVTKTEVSGGTTSAGAGWTVTLSGCGVNQQAVTGVGGTADFTGLEPCANYVVSENVNSKAGFTASGPASVQVAATVAGNTYNVSFTNVKIVGCTAGAPGCTPPPSPSPSPSPTATPTNTPTATPTARPTNTATPTNTPINNVEGAKTPGPGTTPIAPSTGNGIFGGSSSSGNILLALIGLFALSGGLATLAAVRRKAK